jgi:nucleoside-diphosphate-sugar epimerase
MPLDATDLDEILANSGTIWEELRNRRVFLTGGSGFFGSWLLESFCHANRQLGLNARIIVLTRDAGRFASRLPHIAQDAGVEIEVGDFRNFRSPSGPVDYVIHSLVPDIGSEYTTSSQRLHEFFSTSMACLLDLTEEKQARGLLYCSTGAVYASQEPQRPSRETDAMAPGGSSFASLYGPIRRSAELLALLRFADRAVPIKIARGYAYLGPYLRLDGQFAIGNFIADLLARRSIVIKGDGTDIRSYMYGTDLAVWLWTILLRGSPGQAYNVGSSRASCLREVAEVAATTVTPPLEVIVQGGRPNQLIAAKSYYVPDTTKASESLGLKETVGLKEAVARTLKWHRNPNRGIS